MDGSQYALNQWKQDQTDYNTLYSLVEMMVDCLPVNVELVIQILQQSCRRFIREMNCSMYIQSGA